MVAGNRKDLLLSSLLALVVFSLPVSAFCQQLAAEAGLQVVSKHHSSGYIATVGSYVEYEVRLTNEGAVPIEDKSLHVSLVSEGNKTHSAAEYSVSSFEPGESKTLYLGPFRIEEEGGHRLLAQIDGVTLDYASDTFMAYGEGAVQAILVAIPLIACGAGAIGFFFYVKRKAV